MNRLKKILIGGAITILGLVMVNFAYADNPNFWLLSNNFIKPLTNTWNLMVGVRSSAPTEADGGIYYNSVTKTFQCGINGSWQNCATASSTAGTLSGNGTTTQVTYWNGSTSLTGTDNFAWINGSNLLNVNGSINASTTKVTNASTTNLTVTGNTYYTGVTNTYLASDPNGKLIATTTPILTNTTLIAGGTATGPALTVTTTTPDTNVGVTFTASGNTLNANTTWSGTLAVARGGTGTGSAGITAFNNITGFSAPGSTGASNSSLVFANGPTLISPILGTPQSGTMTNVTGLPLTTGVTGVLPIANGGTNTTTPGLIAGNNITITGTWPFQTINSTASGGSGATTTINSVQGPTFTINSGNASLVVASSTGTITLTVATTAIQSLLSLTTTGTSGAATYSGGTLNIPQYQAAGTYLNSYNVVSANGLISVSTTTNLATLTASTSPTFTNGQFTGTLGVTGQTTFNNASGTALTLTGGSFLQNATLTGTLNVSGQTTLATTTITQLTVSQTPSNSDNSTLAVNSAYIHNTSPQCSIAWFSPHADGTTDDSAAFTNAQASCGTIALTEGKSYFIGASTTLTSALIFNSSSTLPQLVIGTGVKLIFKGGVDAPLQKLFTYQGTGTVSFASSTSEVYPEWFGAKGDASTDDTSAIQNAINSISVASSTVTQANGVSVRLQSKVYRTSSPLTINKSAVNIIGNGIRSSWIENTASSTDIIDVAGVAGVDITKWAYNNRFMNFGIRRTVVPTGTSAGFNIQYTQGTIIDQTEAFDSVRNYYFHNIATNGVGYFSDNMASWGAGSVTESSGTYYGFYFDSADGLPSYSLRLSRNTVANYIGSAIHTYGVYITGTANEDKTIDELETASLDYGVYINQTGYGDDHASEDIHFTNSIFDNCLVACIYITGLQSSSGAVNFTGGRIEASTGVSKLVDIENSYGVKFDGAQFFNYGGGTATGVYINGGYHNSVVNGVFTSVGNAVTLNNTSNNIVTSNTMNTSAASSQIFVTLTSANRNTISSNSMSGYNTTGISLDSSSSNNMVIGNVIDTTNITNDVVDSGTGNRIIKQTLASLPATTVNGMLKIQNAAGTADLFDMASSSGAILSRVDFQGHLGIGTTTDTANLAVQGQPSQTYNLVNISSSTGASLFTITPAGYVGIGTSTPGALLDIENTSTTTAPAIIYVGGTTTPTSAKLGCVAYFDKGQTAYVYTKFNNGVFTTSTAVSICQ